MKCDAGIGWFLLGRLICDGHLSTCCGIVGECGSIPRVQLAPITVSQYLLGLGWLLAVYHRSAFALWSFCEASGSMGSYGSRLCPRCETRRRCSVDGGGGVCSGTFPRSVFGSYLKDVRMPDKRVRVSADGADWIGHNALSQSFGFTHQLLSSGLRLRPEPSVL